jgi:general secretion pathway protein J
MSRDPSSSPRNAGFTLVEALFATLLMAVILGALATVTAQWLPNWDRGYARLHRAEALDVGLDRLVADLAAAEYVSSAGGDNVPLFAGAELSVTLVRTTLGPNSVTGLEVVQIAEASDDRGPALVRRTAPFVPLAGQSRDAIPLVFANPVVLLRAPYRVSFSYAGPDRVWRDTWRGEALLPRAVRVRVRDAGNSTTLAVSTSTFIHAELPARCTIPRIAAQCPGLGSSTRRPAGVDVENSQGR